MEAPDFEDFFRRTYPMLTRYALRIIDPSTAEELASAALHTIWVKNLPAPIDEVGRRRLQSLAYRILVGNIRNAQRAERNYQRAVQSLAVKGLEHEVQTDPAADVAGEGWPEWAEPLSLTDREVLELLVDGYKVAEIAVVLDCRPAAVTMRLQRAKKNVRLLWFRGVEREQGTR